MKVSELPTELTEEQYNRVVPEILRFILSDPRAYAAGVDEIIEWDITDNIATGKFADTKGATRKVFSFKYNLDTYDLEMYAISGVED